MTDAATRVSEPGLRREVPPPGRTRPEDLRPVPGRSRLAWAISDAHALAMRHLRQIPRVPELLVFSIIQPIMFVLLFVYVFGGAIKVSGGS